MKFRKLTVLLVIAILCGCINTPRSNLRPISACDISQYKPVRFTKLTVLVYPDQHGDYIRIEECQGHTLDVDFSKSDLFSEKYLELLRLMRFNSGHGGAPVRMRISGVYTGAKTINDVINIFVEKIDSYELSSRP